MKLHDLSLVELMLENEPWLSGHFRLRLLPQVDHLNVFVMARSDDTQYASMLISIRNGTQLDIQIDSPAVKGLSPERAQLYSLAFQQVLYMATRIQATDRDR